GDLRDLIRTNFGGGLPLAGLRDVIPRSDFAVDLHACALGQCAGVVHEPPQQMTRCQVVFDCHSPLARSLQLRLVASERTVKRALLRVLLVSGSLPRYPISETRLVKDMTLVSFSAPDLSRGARKQAEPLPRSPECFVGGTGRNYGERK